MKVLHLIFQATFYRPCDPVPLFYGQETVDHNMDFRLIEAPGYSHPQVMDILHTLYTPDVILYPFKDIGWGGSIGKFAQAFFKDIQTDLYDKE